MECKKGRPAKILMTDSRRSTTKEVGRLIPKEPVQCGVQLFVAVLGEGRLGGADRWRYLGYAYLSSMQYFSVSR
ncbi:hypothetical protein EDD25_2371 [Cryobacterium psychrophilum]|nr:hypothetical protein EDD25_2371 [Cryobacterium psychrophilum]